MFRGMLLKRNRLLVFIHRPEHIQEGRQHDGGNGLKLYKMWNTSVQMIVLPTKIADIMMDDTDNHETKLTKVFLLPWHQSV